jgi:hypothetical protein
LKGISKHLIENQVEFLLLGRKGIITHWLTCLKEVRPVGEKSITILSNDINHIIDKIYGYELV